MANTIAVIWDCDKTLIDGYMQDPLFKKHALAFTRESDEDILFEFLKTQKNEYSKQLIIKNLGVSTSPDAYMNEKNHR